MKKIIALIIPIFLFATSASASWYVINTATNRAVAKTSYEPSKADLETRGEVAVYSNAEVPLLEAELFQGKIQKRAKSQEEINNEVIEAEKSQEMAEVYHLMFRDAYKSAIKEGKTFKHMDKHIDNIEATNAEALIEKQMLDDYKKK